MTPTKNQKLDDKIIILRQGRVSRDEYIVEKQSFTNRKIDEELENTVPLVWEKIRNDAKAKGLDPWDGLFCRLENYNEFKNGVNKLVLSDTIRFSQIKSFQEEDVSAGFL